MNAELRAALTEAGMTNRGLARELAKLENPEPTLTEIEAQRRNVTRWLAGTRVSAAQAERLAVVFGKPASTFMGSWIESNQDLVAETAKLLRAVEEIQAQLRDLIARVESRQAD